MTKKNRFKFAPERKEVEKQLDVVWAKSVKKLAGDKCEVCEKTERLNSHHLFSRVHKSTRWLVENGVCLCYGHHRWLAHGKDSEKFRDWVINKRGQDEFDRLKIKAYGRATHFSVAELLVLLDYSRNELKSIGDIW